VAWIGVQVDIWAAGVTLYYMVEGSAPFKGDSVDDLYSKIGTGEYKMPAREYLPHTE